MGSWTFDQGVDQVIRNAVPSDVAVDFVPVVTVVAQGVEHFRLDADARDHPLGHQVADAWRQGNVMQAGVHLAGRDAHGLR